MKLDVVSLQVADLEAAHLFYKAALSPAVSEQGESVLLDLHGTAKVVLEDGPTSAGFRGYVITYVLEQPSEVSAVLAAAERAGATVLKAPKKSLFAGFSAVFQAPDGAIWKLASPHRKDTGPAGEPPAPTEVGALLAVASPQESKAFYTALGMTADRDYGNKYVDLTLAQGDVRLGMMPRKLLAKDVNVDESGSGTHALVLGHRVGERAQVTALLDKAAANGGRVVSPAAENAGGGFGGVFEDPDGFVWRVSH